jgi:hypothetical protein
MADSGCEVCADKGFIKAGGKLRPCPQCNSDSAYEGNYLLDTKGRCGNPAGGGGRSCFLHAGHRGPHTFECGR